MKKLFIAILSVLLAAFLWLVWKYADEYMKPYRKYEIRKVN